MNLAMGTLTMSFALPAAMRSSIDERVKSGSYGNTSEYLRDLIRRDQELQEGRRGDHVALVNNQLRPWLRSLPRFARIERDFDKLGLGPRHSFDFHLPFIWRHASH